MKKILYMFVFSAVLVFGMVSFVQAEQASMFNVSLGYKSTQKAEVIKLQEFLFTNKYLNVNPTGLYLSGTRKAVADFQKAKGIVPATGYFGPITRAAANSQLAFSVSPSEPQAKVITQSISDTNSAVAGVLLSNQKTIRWQTSNYPQNIGVDINLIRKNAGSTNSFSFVRSIVKNAPNDGEETWIPKAGETDSDMYIEVTCSSSYSFTNGCQLVGAPLKIS